MQKDENVPVGSGMAPLTGGVAPAVYVLARGTAGWTGPPMVICSRGGMLLFTAVPGAAGAVVTGAAAELVTAPEVGAAPEAVGAADEAATGGDESAA